MEDKTPIYILIIVGIVAVVAIVYMFMGAGGHTSSNVITGQNTGNSVLTGNVVQDVQPVDYSGAWRIFLGAVLVGVAVYTYNKE